MWQHLFWFFGHPEVYILALPFLGVASEILPVFPGKPVFGYKGLTAATIGIAVLSMTVWAHHMFTTGAVVLPFSFMTLLIAVPTGVKFFNWIGAIWRGQLTFETPMMVVLGFLAVFLSGGLTGVILASPPLNFHVSDTCFVVAHFHYALLGTVVFCMFGGFYFWWPKWTGKHRERVTAGDRWGCGNSLEGATSCPPPRHNFTSIPRIRPERPAFGLHDPGIGASRTRDRAHLEAPAGR